MSPQLPEGWRRANIRRYASMKTGHTPSRSNPEYWENVTIPWFTLADVWQIRDARRVYLGETASKISELGLANSAAELLPPGTVVLSRTASVGFSGVMPTAMATSQDFWNWVCGPDLMPEYLNYQFKAIAAELRSLNMGSTHQTIYQRDAAAIEIVVPPLAEQRAIASYLDRETARIDTLIEEQQRLIEMLRERRQAAADNELGARVGTGRRLKWLIEELDIRASEVPEDLPLMSVSIDWGVRRRDEVTADETRADDLSNYKVCRSGDLVVNRMRAFQGALGLAPTDGIVSPDYAVLRATPQVNGEWLAATMKTGRFVSEMASRIKGIGSADLGAARTPRINVRDLCDIQLDAPDAGTQADECAHIRRVFDEVDTLIAETETFIELSRERRLALISAAVIGLIDVPEAA